VANGEITADNRWIAFVNSMFEAIWTSFLQNMGFRLFRRRWLDRAFADNGRGIVVLASSVIEMPVVPN
jgi:hypothetical protein